MISKFDRIGIVGGMGAAAGARVMNLLIQECQDRGARVDADFPEINLISLSPHPQAITELGIGDEDMLKEALNRAIYHLEKIGSDIVLVACISAYQFYDWMAAQTRCPIYNPVYATDYVLGRGQKGIICSRSSREAGLWSGLFLDPEEQKLIDNMISRAIGGNTSTKDRRTLNVIINNLIRQGCEKIVLGCTELPLILGSWDDPDIVDPMQIAVEDFFE